MKIKETEFAGLIELEPTVHEDSRGYFFEVFNQKVFEEYKIPKQYVQDNQSYSKKGVLRGLHLQFPPFAQGKLVRVIVGKALDVVVDIRPNSKTFGKHYKSILDSEKNNMLYVPEGFAHGFYALEDCIFFYKCTNYYNKSTESGIIWNDEKLNIDWGTNDPDISDKDLQLPSFDAIMHKF